MAAVMLVFGELAWGQREDGPPCSYQQHLSRQLQLLVKLHPLSSDLGMLDWGWVLSLSLLWLSSCCQILAFTSLGGHCAGMTRWGCSCQLLAAQATASHNFLNKPMKSQARLESPAALGEPAG